MTTEEQIIFIDARTFFGEPHQRMKAIEECSELINALTKYQQQRVNIKDVITELADVSIMVDQMALQFGYHDFLAERARKIERLKKRIEQ